jgi:hypothetical protein
MLMTICLFNYFVHLAILGVITINQNKKPRISARLFLCGERGIRTHGRLITYDCFQDSSIKPLWHFSVGKNRKAKYIAKFERDK